MDSFKVILLPNALKFYKQCLPSLAGQLNKCFKEIEQNPFWGPNIKLLKTQKNMRLYRYKIGGHRVIYEVNKENKKVGVLLISSRPSAYRHI